MKIDKSNLTGEIKLCAGHSIVLGHKPTKIKNENLSDQLISENNQTTLESFGLWEVATPNYATYYPEVTQDDLNPKDEEFIQPVFRMLSEVVVGKNWRPIDFGKKGVLKKSMQMLLGQTINIDHEIAVGNAVGAVAEVYWQAAYKTKSGIEVPAGINAVLKIDGKSNPRIARGIMMEPPSIHSNSVTVRFKWEPSHTLEDMGQFYNLLGTYDSNGEMYRLVVTEILGYSETSLVSHGADPYAQKIKEDGEIANPEYADRQSFSKDGKVSGFVEFDFKTELSLSKEDNSIPQNNINNEETNLKEKKMDKLIENLIETFGFAADELTEENIAVKLKEKFDAQAPDAEVATLKQEKETLEAELTTTKAELTAAKANKAEMENLTAQTRTEAERLYKLCKGEEADETMLGLISTADLKTSSAFVKQYQKESEEKFKSTCSDCGGHNISKASASATKDGLIVDKNEGNEGKKNLSSQETVSNLKTKKRKASIALQTQEQK